MPAIILPHDPADLSAGIDLHYTEHVEHVELSVVSGNLRFRLRTASGARYDVHGAVAAMGALQVLDLSAMPKSLFDAASDGVLTKKFADAMAESIEPFAAGAAEFLRATLVARAAGAAAAESDARDAQEEAPDESQGSFYNRLSDQAQGAVAASPALMALASISARIEHAGSPESFGVIAQTARRGIIAELRARGVS